MEGFKGTPGIWNVSFHGPNNCWIVDSENESAIAKVMRYKNDGYAQRANFKLIAAAPELLEACLRIQAQFSQAGVASVAGSLNPAEDAAAQIDAAIKKALGQ